MLRTTVAQIITVNRGDYDITQFHIVNGAGQVFRLTLIGRIGPAMRNITE